MGLHQRDIAGHADITLDMDGTVELAVPFKGYWTTDPEHPNLNSVWISVMWVPMRAVAEVVKAGGVPPPGQTPEQTLALIQQAVEEFLRTQYLDDYTS